MAERADQTAVKALKAFVGSGKALLDLAEKESKEGSLQEFIRQKIRIEQRQSLLGLIEAAAALYRSLSVQRKKDAENLWRQNNHCAALQEAVRDFEQLEVRWDAFLQRLDDELQLSAKILDREHQPRCISPDISLIDARTGGTATLGKYLGKGKKILLVLIRQFSCLLCRLHLKDLEKNQNVQMNRPCATASTWTTTRPAGICGESQTTFICAQCDDTQLVEYQQGFPASLHWFLYSRRSLDANSVEVVVVSFGCQEGASHWLQETNCPYDMLLDRDRKMYAAFGLGASLMKVLNFSNMLLYAEYVVDNMEFPRGLQSIQDDMFQLGGDFVLDERGKVLFSHCCQSPIDRPSVEDILSAQ